MNAEAVEWLGKTICSVWGRDRAMNFKPTNILGARKLMGQTNKLFRIEHVFDGNHIWVVRA